MNRFDNRKNQSGAALVISLVLLVVVSVLAISSYENAFQAAETGLEQALAQRPFNTLAVVNMSFDTDTGNEQVNTVIGYENSTLVPDRAFSVGSGVSACHFLATATADSKREGVSGAATDRDASAVHSQAFYVVCPSSPTL